MKSKLVGLSLVLALFCAGCNKAETKRISRETSGMAQKFNELVKQGKTTRQQEQAYIAAVAGVAYELDRAIRGTAQADITKKNAIIEAQTGVNPEGPIDLTPEPKGSEQPAGKQGNE